MEKQLKLAGNPLLCMRLRQRLTSEAEDERGGRDQERRVEVKAGKARLEGETVRMHHEMDMMMHEVAALAKSKGEHDSDEDKPEKLQYDKIVMEMPRAPDVKNTVDGVSGDDWTKFGVGTVAYARQRDEDLGEIYVWQRFK